MIDPNHTVARIRAGIARRTKRRYAHELYPHADEWETRPLEVEVPYLYARAIGFRVEGTSWIDMPGETQARRTTEGLQSARTAFIADALLQGLSGDEAWAWADTKLWGYPDEWLYERGVHYGVGPERIKPYPCGPEPDQHDHYELSDNHGWHEIIRIEGCESDCPDCTEEVQP